MKVSLGLNYSDLLDLCFWTILTGYDSPSSVTCRRPISLETLRSSLFKCYALGILLAWIFIQLSLLNHVLLRVKSLDFVVYDI